MPRGLRFLSSSSSSFFVFFFLDVDGTHHRLGLAFFVFFFCVFWGVLLILICFFSLFSSNIHGAIGLGCYLNPQLARD